MNTKSGRGTRATGWTRLDEAYASGDQDAIAAERQALEYRSERSRKERAAKASRRERQAEQRRERIAELEAAGMSRMDAMRQAKREGF